MVLVHRLQQFDAEIWVKFYHLCYTQGITLSNDPLTQSLWTSLHSAQIELEQRGANVSHR